MAIVQISKIQHRTGANVDLPQLDIGEFGFATDEQRLYIGNDPTIVPPVGPGATTQTEILTDASPLSFSRITGSSNLTLDTSSIQIGQPLVIDFDANIGNIVKNYDGNLLYSSTKINYGSAANMRITGGTNGFILSTDGTGNLSWVTNGALAYKIQSITDNGDGNTLVTTNSTHFFGTGTSVTISGVLPTGVVRNAVQTSGVSGTNQFYVARVSNTTFTIHDGSNVADPGSQIAYNPIFSGYTANSADVVGQITPTGNITLSGTSNTQVLFNDTGAALGGSSAFTFDTSANLLTLGGNLDITGYVNGNLIGYVDGEVGATTPNNATFTSIQVNNNANVTANLTADIIHATNNGNGTNFKVGDDIWIGDINISDTLQLSGVANTANAYIVFGDNDTTSLGRAGSGPLTYGGDMDVSGNLTANTVTSTSFTQLAVYADDTARDAAITSPAEGMLVFNQTGAKFQGYDGTNWVDLN